MNKIKPSKAGIVEALFHSDSEMDYSKEDCRVIVEAIFETIKSTLENGEDIKLSGFGVPLSIYL